MTSESLQFSPNTIVTVKFENSNSSNTYYIEQDLGESVLLRHPLAPECLFKFPKNSVDIVFPTLKDSLERGLTFVKNNSDYLDYETNAELEALCIYYALRRKLTPRQKYTLSNMGGVIASHTLDNDLNKAMSLVKENSALLDEFNSMWFKNFSGLFNGTQTVSSKKQRSAIFNMAGFVLAELHRVQA